MLDLRKFDTLGHFQIDWLNARHHFSFGHYFDRERTSVGPLRVWNDDEIQPGRGFDPHPHRDMEIITYVRQGAITHKDSLGNEGRTEAGDVQVMSAGTGITHSEFNREDDLTRIFQIWIIPRTTGRPPRWESREFPKSLKDGALTPLASGEEHVEGAMWIDQDATLYAGVMAAGTSLTQVLKPGRQAYLVPARGSLKVNGTEVSARDGLVIRDVTELTLEASEETEVLLADLPGGELQ